MPYHSAEIWYNQNDFGCGGYQEGGEALLIRLLVVTPHIFTTLQYLFRSKQI